MSREEMERERERERDGRWNAPPGHPDDIREGLDRYVCVRERERKLAC